MTNDTKHDDGGPAFPQTDGRRWGNGYDDHGMSLRDWFAATASDDDLCGVPDTIDDAAALLGVDPKDYNGRIHYPMIRAMARYAHADAMLAERKRRTK